MHALISQSHSTAYQYLQFRSYESFMSTPLCTRYGWYIWKLILFGHCMILCSKSNMCSFFVINALYIISCNTRSCYNETPLNISITAVHPGQFTNSAISHPPTFWLPVLSISIRCRWTTIRWLDYLETTKERSQREKYAHAVTRS